METRSFFRFVLEAGKGLTAKMSAIVITIFALTSFSGEAVASSALNNNPSVIEGEADDDDEIFVTAEKMPSFPGGNYALHDYLESNLRYPHTAAEQQIEGRVYVRFVVEKDGSISDVKVARRANPTLEKEAIRVISSMPDWTPGVTNGHAVRVVYTVPISFKLQ